MFWVKYGIFREVEDFCYEQVIEGTEIAYSFSTAQAMQAEYLKSYEFCYIEKADSFESLAKEALRVFMQCKADKVDPTHKLAKVMSDIYQLT